MMKKTLSLLILGLLIAGLLSSISLANAANPPIVGSWSYSFEGGNLIDPAGVLYLETDQGGTALHTVSGGYSGGFAASCAASSHGQIQKLGFALSNGSSWTFSAYMKFTSLTVPSEQTYGTDIIRLLTLHGSVDTAIMGIAHGSDDAHPVWVGLYGDSGGLNTNLDGLPDELKGPAVDTWYLVSVKLSSVPRYGGAGADWTADFYVNGWLGAEKTWYDSYGPDIGHGYFGIDTNWGATFTPSVTVIYSDLSVIDPPWLQPIQQGLTLYFRGDTKTVADHTAYFMAPSYTNTYSESYKTAGSSSYTLAYSIDLLSVWNTSTNLANYVGQSYSVMGKQETLISQWDCPNTILQVGQYALQLKVYVKFGGSSEWMLMATWVSDYLNYKSLTEQTWTFKMFVDSTYETNTELHLMYGQPDYASGIFGIGVKTANQYETAVGMITSGDLVGGAFYPFIFVLHDAFWLILCLMFLAPLYVRYKHFGIILIFFIVFGGGAGSVMNLFIPPPFLYGAWIVVLFGMTALAWRAVR